MLKIENLHVSYGGIKALRGISLEVPDGSQGAGEAVDVDTEGRLVVRTDAGEQHVFTGEVSVHGIYGAV